jgi:hypothetical protein
MAVPSQEGINAFVRAAHAGDAVEVNMMLVAFPDPEGRRNLLLKNTQEDLPDRDGNPITKSGGALNAAIWMGHSDIALRLLDAVETLPDPNEVLSWSDYGNVSAAAFNNDKAVFERLMQMGLPVDDVSSITGWTASHASAASGSIEASFMVLRHGGDPTLEGKNGHSPAIHAKKAMDLLDSEYKSKFLTSHPNYAEETQQTSALWHAAEVAWTTDDTAKLDAALDAAQAVGVDRGELVSSIAQGLENAEKPPAHAAAIIAHLGGRGPDAARTAEADASAAQASGATAGLAGQTGKLSGEFTVATKDGYKTLSLDGHAELQLLADAAQGIEGARQVWEAQGRHWKVGDEHVPAYVSLPPGTDYDTAAGHAREHGLQVAHNPNVQGELALWNPHLAGAAGLELSVPRGAGDAKVAQAPKADAPPAHEAQQQLIPGPFGVSL